MSFDDERFEVADHDVAPLPRGTLVVFLSPGQRAAIRLELARVFETSTDSATITAARRILDAMELQ